jgi:gliding motility-associated lipoprotein GldD
LDSLIFDSRKLVNKHIQRADDIVEESVEVINPNMHGVIFSIQGNTATNYNFYVTDSARHFLRGALYFNGHTVQDSIAPAFNFVKKDVEHLIHTLHWK